MVDRMGVIMDKPRVPVVMQGPVYIDGHLYIIEKDLNKGRFSFRYAVKRRKPFSGTDWKHLETEYEVVITSLTLWGAQVYLWKKQNWVGL